MVSAGNSGMALTSSLNTYEHEQHSLLVGHKPSLTQILRESAPDADDNAVANAVVRRNAVDLQKGLRLDQR